MSSVQSSTDFLQAIQTLRFQTEAKREDAPILTLALLTSQTSTVVGGTGHLSWEVDPPLNITYKIAGLKGGEAGVTLFHIEGTGLFESQVILKGNFTIEDQTGKGFIFYSFKDPNSQEWIQENWVPIKKV